MAEALSWVVPDSNLGITYQFAINTPCLCVDRIIKGHVVSRGVSTVFVESLKSSIRTAAALVARGDEDHSDRCETATAQRVLRMVETCRSSKAVRRQTIDRY